MDNYESLRQRAIMLPLPPNYESLQTSPQSQCPIFVSLPPEIRRLIWIKCLGGLRVPLSFSNQYRCDRLCSHGGLAGSSPLCNQTYRPKVKKRIEHRLLPILLTCQRVYEPSIHLTNILYDLWHSATDTRKPLVSSTLAMYSIFPTQSIYSTFLSSSYRHTSTLFALWNLHFDSRKSAPYL